MGLLSTDRVERSGSARNVRDYLLRHSIDKGSEVNAYKRWEWHRRRQFLIAAVTLLLLDALFLAANLVHWLTYGYELPGDFAIYFSGIEWNGEDGSHVEIFGHMQLFAGAVMLGFLEASRRSRVYAAWMVALLVLVADDFFMIHERVGLFLVDAMSISPIGGLRPVDIGELIVWGALGVIVGTSLILTTVRASGVDRRNSIVLFFWVGVLAVFAVVLDQLHFLIAPHVHPLVDSGLTFVETTGELVGMTLIVLAILRMTLDDSPNEERLARGAGRGATRGHVE